ncbi:hypothetical protein COO60DRAFT_1157792 [Scenedesmus sp. NREL 46B-D3]|nr:hypothetical protein COO60DRAFT_1157792 [Scenedesmus sp. NREL 46B-D3]
MFKQSLFTEDIMRSLKSPLQAAAAARHKTCCCRAYLCDTAAAHRTAVSSSVWRPARCASNASTSNHASSSSARAISQQRCRPVTAAKSASAAKPHAIPPVKHSPEAKAQHKRPPGWTAPGPSPVGLQGPAAAAAAAVGPGLQPQANETLSYLTGDWRIFQLKDGHRCAAVCGSCCQQDSPLLLGVWHWQECSSSLLLVGMC